MASFDTQNAQTADRHYVRRSMAVPLLTREDEQDLARAWRDRGDVDALHQLVRAYARLVVSLASRYRNYAMPMGDLVQEGNVGLMMAASRFDPDRNVRFSTYAMWWIRAAIQDFILRNHSIVRTGTTAGDKSLFFNLRRLRARMGEGTNGPMSHEARLKIAVDLGVSVEAVEAMEGRLSVADHSLNAGLDEDGGDSWIDFLADDRPGPEEVVVELRDSDTRSRWLKRALTELSQRERVIIHERRLREDAVTLQELGHELGISKERVRQIEQRAIEKLRTSITRQMREADQRSRIGAVAG